MAGSDIRRCFLVFLQYSALCFSFTKPGRRELRERKEKKWIKVAV
jgi:hypothetical protein